MASEAFINEVIGQLTADDARRIVKEVLTNHKHDLQSLPQNSLKELEVKIQAWLYCGMSNLMLASVNLLVSRFMQARRFNAALPQINQGTITNVMSENADRIHKVKRCLLNIRIDSWMI
jgi:hypothetical protein